ncbi:MAG: 5-phospho-D-xylono,4-lactonase [Microbacteriaceae bacterium]|nr:5-phospho-D-xylono,4-lactonase [Microbacteriaceae bacterium]
MSGAVRTALGDIDASTLGRTDYHDHLLQVTPLLPGDELDDERLSGMEATRLADSGFDAMVDATPTGLGRNPVAVARISADAALRVVLTTGAHREEHYGSDHWLLGLSAKQLAEAFLTDVRDALPVRDGFARAEPAEHDGQPVRAGLLKAGIGYWRISMFERRVLAAVAEVHRETGAPVMVHTEYATAAFEVLELLADGGVPADAVVLAHVDRNPDPVLHADLAAAGAYLGYDTFARAREQTDSTLVACAARAVELGAGKRILLGGDVARRSRYLAYGGMPGLEYLGRRVVPRVAAAVGEDVLRDLLVANPARLLARF